MFKITDEIKSKLVRDLSKQWFFERCEFEFCGNMLLNHDKRYGTSVMEFEDIPFRFSYTKLLTAVTLHFKNVREIQNEIENQIVNMSYKEFLKKVKVVKLEVTSFDEGVFYRINNDIFQFIVQGVDLLGSLEDRIAIFITSAVLKKHGVDIETFFYDVVDDYKGKGIDILDDSFKRT